MMYSEFLMLLLSSIFLLFYKFTTYEIWFIYDLTFPAFFFVVFICFLNVLWIYKSTEKYFVPFFSSCLADCKCDIFSLWSSPLLQRYLFFKILHALESYIFFTWSSVSSWSTTLYIYHCDHSNSVALQLCLLYLWSSLDLRLTDNISVIGCSHLHRQYLSKIWFFLLIIMPYVTHVPVFKGLDL